MLLLGLLLAQDPRISAPSYAPPEALIEQLIHDDPGTRALAEEGLYRYGRAALPALEKAFQDGANSRIKLAAKRIRAELVKRLDALSAYRAGGEAAPEPTEWAATILRLEALNAKTPDRRDAALKTLSRLEGITPDNAWARAVAMETIVDLDLKNGTLSDLVATVEKQTGLKIRLAEGVDPATPFDVFKVSAITTNAGLRLGLGPRGLTYVVSGRDLMIQRQP